MKTGRQLLKDIIERFEENNNFSEYAEFLPDDFGIPVSSRISLLKTSSPSSESNPPPGSLL